MKKFSEIFKNNKTKYWAIITVVLFILVIISTGTIFYQNNGTSKNIKLLTKAESLISNDDYQSALDILNGINEKKDNDLINKINHYKTVINEFNSLDTDLSLAELKLSLENFIKDNEETINLEIFSNMKDDLSKLLNSTESKILKLDSEKVLILSLIEENSLENAEKALRTLMESYPKEDFTAINTAIEDKREKLQKEQDEQAKKEQQEEQAKIEETESQQQANQQQVNNVNTQTRIANTYAASNSSQLITVVSTGGSSAELTLWQKDTNGTWYEYGSFFARIGSSGMRYASEVREMDMCTPTGSYSLTEAFGIMQNPGTELSYRVLDGSEYWVDDPESSYYNTMQFGSSAGRWNSAEDLKGIGTPYNYSIVIDYNRWPVIPYASSAIFLHVDVGVATWGCVAVSQDKMVQILQWLKPSQNPRILLDFSYDSIYNNY